MPNSDSKHRTKDRTQVIKHIRSSSQNPSVFKTFTNAVKEFGKGIGNFLGGGSNSTSSYNPLLHEPINNNLPPKPLNVPRVRPEIRNGYKQSQGNVSVFINNNVPTTPNLAFQYNSSLDALRNARKNPAQSGAFNYSFSNTPLNGTMNDRLIGEAAADLYANEGVMNKNTEDNLSVISDIFSGKYSYGVDQKEFDEWRRAAFKQTGEYEKDKDGNLILDENGNPRLEEVLRPDAPPPPMGTDEATYNIWLKNNTYLTQEYNEETGEWEEVRHRNEDAEDVPVTTDEFKKYWNWYLAYQNKLTDETKRAEEKTYHMAGIDPKATDSMFDVLRNVINGKEDPVKGTIEYFNNYVWNPLKNHDWTVLGLNTLVNLGETMDIFSSGLRAITASKDVLKFSNSNVYDEQNAFVYSGGEDKQKELMDLGAERLIYLNTRRPRNYEVQAEKIKNKLMEAGKWDDFVRLENEWRAHENEGSVVENIKEVYTQPSKNFYVDSGSAVEDLLLETILDPTLLVGGIAKGVASTGAHTVTRAAIKDVAEGIASKDVIDFVTSGNKAVKQYVRNAGEGLLMQNRETVKASVEVFANKMIKDGVIDQATSKKFVDSVVDAIGEVKGNKQYRFIQSMHRADVMADRLDSALLKTSFAVPYVPFSTARRVRKLLRNNKWYADFAGSGKGLKEKQAMSELFDGLKDKDGRINVASFKDIFDRVNNNITLRDNVTLRSDVIQSLTKDFESYMSNINELSEQLVKEGFSPREFDEALNLRIRQTSNGALKSVDDLTDYIDEIFNKNSYKFSSELDDIKRIIDDQIKNIDVYKANSVHDFSVNFVRDLDKARTVGEIQELVTRVQRFSDYIDDPSEYHNIIMKRVNKLKLGAYDSVDDFVREFEFKNSVYTKKQKSVVDSIFKNMDERSRYMNEIHPNIKKPLEEFSDFLDQNFKSLGVVGQRELHGLLFDAGKRVPIEDINPRDLHSAINTVLQEKQLKIASANYREASRDADTEIIEKLLQFDSQLVNTQLSVFAKDEKDLLELHCDIFNVFNNYVSDPRFQQIYSFFNQDNGVIKQFKNLNTKFHEGLNGKSFDGLGMVFDKISNTINSFNKQAVLVEKYNGLCTRLKQIPGLTDDQYWTILDSIFGLSRYNPGDFTVKNSRNLDNLIDKVNLNMDTLFGESRVRLDGFRKEARDYSGELWKDYADEISDPDIQKRVDTILSDGHLDPTKDVETQMLQLILRDKGSIEYYNNLARTQDVLFLDIETQGLSSDIHKITDIAFKRWDPNAITSESNLKDILDFIEKGDTERYTTKSLAEDIDQEISTQTLKELFVNEPNAGRNEWLRKYKDIYAADSLSNVKTEEDILRSLMTDLDRSADAMGKTPVLVTHSNRGFDMNFISTRVRYYKNDGIDLFPSHIAHMQDLVNASESTVERLKGLTGDILLTSEQSSLVKDAIVSFSKNVPYMPNNFKLLNTSVYNNMFEIGDDLEDIFETGLFNDFIQFCKINGLPLDPEFEELFHSLRDVFSSKEFIDQNKAFKEFTKDVFYDTSRFNGNLVFDSRSGKSFFERTFVESDNGSIPEVGYKKIGIDTSKYFDLESAGEVPYDVLVKCSDFTKQVESTVLTQLKQNDLVKHYYNDFRRIVEVTIDYAKDLKLYDPFGYFKYMKVPDTPYEAYVMAQMIWDQTLKYVGDNTIANYTKIYKSAKAVPAYVRDYVLDFAISGKQFDLFDEGISEAALGILKGDSDEFIYKHYVPDEYYPKLTTPLEDKKAFDQMQSEIDYHLKTGSAYTSIAEEYYDKAIDYALNDAHINMSEIADLVKTIEKDLDGGVTDTGISKRLANLLDGIKKYHNDRRTVMTAQIMDYVTGSEDNLISHLLFHNHQLHIPVSGHPGHSKQVDILREMLNNLGDDTPIVYKESNGYLHIGISKDTKINILNDSRYVDENATVKINNRDTVYSAPQYSAIEFNVDDLRSFRDDSLYIKSIGEDGIPIYDELAIARFDAVISRMKNVYDQVDFLTEGKGVGSVGTLHTLNRQHQLYKSLPKDFLDEILLEDISCDARFWHQASFDMSCLGNSENVWKVTDYNDADPLLSLYKTLEEATGSATAERMYLGYWDNAESPFKINNILADVSDKEKIQILNNVDDMVVVNFNKSDSAFFGGIQSETGVEVYALDIEDLSDLKRAEASGAMLVPYDVFLDMQEVFNKSTVTSTFLKGWSKILWLYKVGQLGNPGTWLRNWLDATMKMTAEVGTAGEAAQYQLKAAHMLMNYKKISSKIQKQSGLNYTTATDIEREFARLPEHYKQYMTFEEYKFIDDWLQISISGGEARTLKSVKKYTNDSVNLNVALKKGDTSGRMTPAKLERMKQEYDLVGDTITRFEELGEDEIQNLISNSGGKLWRNMDKERFLQIVREGQNIASDDELFEYNIIVNKLIEQRFKKMRGTKSVRNVVDQICGATFAPMSGVEEIVRFSQYIALEEKGLTRSQIFKSIASSQFNYDNKTMRAKMLEMFIPYYGFMDANISYWLRALDENPRMLRYIEHIWGTLSWDAAFQYGEDPEENGSVNYMMGHGGIPIGSSGMYLKTEPSFLQPLNLMLGSPSEYVNTLAAPFQLGIRAFLNNGAGEYSAIFHEVTDMTSKQTGMEQFLNSLPIFGTMRTRYYSHFTDKKEWERLVGENDLEEALVKYNPSLFGAVKRGVFPGTPSFMDDIYASSPIEQSLMKLDPMLFGIVEGNKEDVDGPNQFDLFQKKLAKQDKWWDQNLQRVVPLDQKNTEGLNDPDLSWEERVKLMFILHNKIWDANQGVFVDVDDYEPGGLNQVFDFDNPGDWDKLCKLKEKKLGQKWDANTRKWIDKDDWEPIMLNDPDCTWEDNQRYHEELFGEKFDHNQGKYVQKDQYIEGGLNSKKGELSFSELCALQYILHGKEWIPGEGFVKTREPLIQFDLMDIDPEKTIKLDRTDPKLKALAMLGIFDVAYADEATVVEEPKKKSEVHGRWVLNGDPEHDAAVFEDIITNYSNVTPGFGGYPRYSRWRKFELNKFSRGYGEFSDLPQLPKGQYVKPKRKFSNPYTSGGEYAALRMALYGTKIYEDYYKFEFSYNYNYRSPSAGPKKYYGSLYHAGQYDLKGKRNRSSGKWRYYNR